MSIWPIIFLGMVSAFFAWRREKVQELFDPGRWQKTKGSNKDELRRSLDALIDLLCKHEEFRWVAVLRAIRTKLDDPAAEEAALARLSNMFGGMGSLNDPVFGQTDAEHEEGDRLRDAVFRDMKLYYGAPSDRAEWAALEEKHKGELPPRIKHAFRKE
jgi:hypothetical protein